MPLFECSRCHCYENTALSNWAVRFLYARLEGREPSPPLCSECDPEIGKWHGEFPKMPAAGMFREADDKNQFLYHDQAEAKALNARGKLVRVSAPTPEGNG